MEFGPPLKVEFPEETGLDEILETVFKLCWRLAVVEEF